MKRNKEENSAKEQEKIEWTERTRKTSGIKIKQKHKTIYKETENTEKKGKGEWGNEVKLNE